MMDTPNITCVLNSLNFLWPALETDFRYREAIAEACSSLSSAHLLLRNQEPDLYLHLWHGSYVHLCNHQTNKLSGFEAFS